MRVLIGCEESGKTRDAFTKLGHDAWSCDLQPSRSKGNHLQIDVIDAIRNYAPWDIIILHPPCDYLTVSGNRWYGVGKKGYGKRLRSIEWTKKLFSVAKQYAIVGVALENPVGVLSKELGKPQQYINPYQFGHAEQKKTCLWLHGLPELSETNNVYELMMSLPKNKRQRVWNMPPG